MTKETLWRNVSALMHQHWGKEHLARLQREAGIALGTVSRLKACETSVGLDVLERVASVFGLQPWQLLVPGLDPANPPTLQPVTPEERQLYERLRAVMDSIKSGT